MAITECGNGHLYDTNQYASCPYCNGGGNVINFGVGNAGNEMGNSDIRTTIGKTAAISGYAGSGEPEKTVAPEGYHRKSEEINKTVGVFSKKINLEPIVGWLVCVEGPEKGKDYHLWARINTIGRSEKMDVCIKGDQTISRENHARIAYDPKHNNFQLIPAESINNIYLNDEPVYIPAKLSAYDVIELGDSKMIFVPFCCDRFRWPLEKEQGEKE